MSSHVRKPVTKQQFRQRVWEYLEKHNIADFPRPVYGRIPNYKGSAEASKKLLTLECFKRAKTVEVNPDKPLEECRALTLLNNKELLVPVCRLQDGFLKRLRKDNVNSVRKIASRWGMDNLGKIVDLDEEIRIDVIVLGSVAVSKTGYRIGKGKGFADLEYAILREIKAVDDSTTIVTVVHDCQVFEGLPQDQFGKHDVPVDIILTPTQIIEVPQKLSRSEGICWELLSQKQIKEMPILSHFKPC